MILFNKTMQEALKELPDNSVDSIVTDPPYHLTSIADRFGPGQKPVEHKEGSAGAYSRSSKGFMGKEWDGGDVAFRVETWAECMRVLKPGGFLVAFSGSRTYHRMAVSIEDAGFEIRDQVMWCYNSGFPKSHNVGKNYDKKYGNERVDVGANPNNRSNPDNVDNATHDYGFTSKSSNITVGNGPFEGWGTALKPAHEPIAVCRKPLDNKIGKSGQVLTSRLSVLENMEKWGVGSLNIEASRVPFTDEVDIANYIKDSEGPKKRSKMTEGDNIGMFQEHTGFKKQDGEVEVPTGGRWPANLLHDGLWNDEKHGKFYFVPKVSKRERNEGLEDFQEGTYSNDGRETTNDTAYQRGNNVSKNVHPTVKPIELMHYLIRMVTPTGGTTLDPFMGSGSTGCAAVSNGFDFIGVEMEESSYETAKARIEYFQTKRGTVR